MEEKSQIQKIYENPKAKGFINHLIGAYLPVHKVEKVWDFKKGQDHKCNICHKSLASIEELFQNFQKNKDEFMDDTMKNIMNAIDGKEVKVEDHPMYKHVSKGKVQAFTGEKTDTVLCMTCIQDLLDMTQTLLLTGDKNIEWRLNKLRRETVFNTFKESEKLEPKEKEKVEEIEKRVEKSKTKKITTFGDLEILQNLKSKMEEEENGK